MPDVIDLREPTICSIEDISEALERKVKETNPGEWIRGFGWNEVFLGIKNRIRFCQQC